MLLCAQAQPAKTACPYQFSMGIRACQTLSRALTTGQAEYMVGTLGSAQHAPAGCVSAVEGGGSGAYLCPLCQVGGGGFPLIDSYHAV